MIKTKWIEGCYNPQIRKSKPHPLKEMKVKIDAHVVELINSGKVTCSVIAKELGVSKPWVSRRLNRLESEGVLTCGRRVGATGGYEYVWRVV